MAKNNTFINQQKRLAQQMESTVPAIYASIAMSLVENTHLSFEDIELIFARSQEIWHNHPGNIIDLLINCYNETGIQLMTEKQYDMAMRNGLIEQ